MKTHRTTAFTASIFLLLIPASTALADPPRFVLTKTVIPGGGSTLTSPRFTLTGTIGQPEAAPRFVSTDGRFTLAPGFWGDYSVVQQPDLPLLTIRRGAAGFFVLAWPVDTVNATLEQSLDLTPNSWTTVTTRVIDTSTEHTVTVPINAPKKFFRLSVTVP
jgi:hypothetical protein